MELGARDEPQPRRRPTQGLVSTPPPTFFLSLCVSNSLAPWRRVPHFRLTSDIGNLWEGYGGPTMGVITTVDVIQAIPDVWGCTERPSVMSRLRDP